MAVMWFSPGTGVPMVTLAPYGLTFNSACLEFMQTASSIKLGCDCKEGKLIVVLLNDKSGFNIPPMDNEVKNIRISAKEFIQYVSVKCGINIVESPKYFIEIVSNTELFIDLKSPIIARKRTKSASEGKKQ